jgi:N utilization substance protein B
MLSRRHLRIKVMQVLYTQELEHTLSLNAQNKYLENLLSKSEELYYLILIYLIEITQYSIEYKDKKSAKLLATFEDKAINISISDNPIINHLRSSKEFQSHIKRLKIQDMVSDIEVKNLFESILKREKYIQYCTKEDKTLDDHKEVLIHIIKKIIDNSEDLFMHLDADFLNLSDDFHTINFLLQKDIDKFDFAHTNNFIFSVEADKDDLNFCKELLELTFIHDKKMLDIISPKLKGWEIDRIAIMDIIILKMAITEMMYFPFIPVKVSMNEYIDIAKSYSTPKSKDFINGILDKIMHELKQEGHIVKKGRGLMEQ